MQYFVLRPVIPSPAETEYIPVRAPKSGEPPRCPRCNRAVAPAPWVSPRRAVVLGHGSEFGDIAFGLADGLLVSARFRRAWEAEGLAGIVECDRLAAMRCCPLLPGRAQDYAYCTFERGAAVAVPLDARTRMTPGAQACDLCGGGVEVVAFRGFSIDESTWSGADLFLPWGVPATLVATERVLDAASKHFLRNVTAIRVEDHVHDPELLLGPDTLH
jgi:hypothetical protein